MNSSDKKQKNICLYFQVHQPRRLSHFRFFDIDTSAGYFNDQMNFSIMRRIARQCYLPANLMLLRLIHEYPQLRITFSISGIALEQMELYAPEVIETFRMLAQTGSVEFLSETYYHSLSFLAGRHEFETQVRQHQIIMKRLLGVEPAVFRNTELIYADNLGRVLEEMGFKGTLLEGAEQVIGYRNPNHLYEAYGAPNLRLLLRNYRLSDDIAFRYSNHKWGEWPLTAAKYMHWLEQLHGSNELINLGMDYETFGEHQSARSGIFRFLEELLRRLAESRSVNLVTPSEAIERLRPATYLPVPYYSSWADRERDLSAWLGNDLQKDAHESLLALAPEIYEQSSEELLHHWRQLQTSDHFYYMSTKKYDDGGVHSYFSPYDSPYEAFMNYMNVLTDLRLRVRDHKKPALAQKKADRKSAVKPAAAGKSRAASHRSTVRH